MAHDGRIYTAGEKFERYRLIVKGGRQAQMRGSEDLVDAKIENRIDHLDERAASRYGREAGMAFGQAEAAENEAARAKLAMRAARGPERAAARKAYNDAKAAARRADSAARRYR